MHTKNAGKYIPLILLIPAVCLLCSCEQKKELPSHPPQVRYTEISGRKIHLTQELPGRVSALTVSDVRPQVGGIIKERLFTEGADVKAGQVLYHIDPQIYQAAYNNAKANLKKAEANAVTAKLLCERYGKLVKTNAVSRQEYDDAEAAAKRAEAEVASAKEALETAKIDLGYTKVTAPVSGRIGRSFVTPGALVTQNQPDPLATIQQLDQVYVDVTYPTAELLKMRRTLAQGSITSDSQNAVKVRLKLEDGSAYVRLGTERSEGEPKWIEGSLLFSDVTVDQSTGVVNIRAKFKNPDGLLLPGMYVRALMHGGVKENAVLVPQKSVFRDTRGNPLVYVLNRSAPENAQDAPTLKESEFFVDRRPVTLDGSYRDNTWIISAGLKPGDKVIVDGIQKIRAGQIARGTDVTAEKPSAVLEMQTAQR